MGAWTRDKHDILRRYVAATRGTRAKYLPPNPGGAAFIDLFAGPGRARVRGTKEVIDGSPLIAMGHAEHPFGELVLCEADPENVAALRRRTASNGDRVIPVWEVRRFAHVYRERYGPLLTRALGTDEWERILRHPSDAPQLIPLFHRQLETRYGYTPENSYGAPIRGDNRVALYHLVFASKNSRGDRIWESVTRQNRNGQRRLF